MVMLRGLIAWLAAVDWLTTGAFLLTIGAFLGAVLDSYTSLCTVGGDLAHIGQASSCPDVYGWDTRTFPLAVDLGWGGALLATIRLAHTLGLANWRWWAVLTFEGLTAGTTVAGNAVHGAVVGGSANHLLQVHPTAIAGIASAVPGVVAVGAGFTLSALISSRHAGQPDLNGDRPASDRLADRDRGRPGLLRMVIERLVLGRPTVMTATGDRSQSSHDHGRVDDRPATAPRPAADSATGHDGGRKAGRDRGPKTVTERPAGNQAEVQSPGAVMTAEEARAAVERLVRQASGRGRQVTAADVQRVTGRQARQARRLLAAATAVASEAAPGGRPRVLTPSSGTSAVAEEG